MKRGIQCLTCLIFLFPSLCIGETPQTLERLIASALQGHPAIQAQQAQQLGAKVDVESATWQFYPTPSLIVERAQASASDGAYRGDGTVSTLRLQQPIWTGGRLTAGKEKAEAGVILSQATLEEVRQQLALRVVQIYSDWLAAHLKAQANEKSLATHVDLRDQVTRRIEQGISPQSDLLLAVGRLKSVTADMSLAHAQKDIALARLKQLVGYPIDDKALNVAVAAPRPINSSLQTLLDLALAADPMVQKAHAQAELQKAVIAERRADLSPEIYVRAERQYGNTTYGNSTPENRLFIGVSSRFGAGLSSLSHVESAKWQHQAALAEVEVRSRSISEQVLADYALANSLEHRSKALKESLEAAKQVAKSYDRQFLAGRKSWLDVMNAARELAQTEVQLADMEAARVVTTWRLTIITSGMSAVAGRGQ